VTSLRLAKEVLGRAVAVKFRIDPGLFRSHREAQEEPKQNAPVKGKRSVPVVELPPVSPQRVRDKSAGRHKSTTPSMFPEPEGPAASPRKPVRRGWAIAAGSNSKISWLARATVAYAAALSVVEKPGDDGNPLVFHGPRRHGQDTLLEASTPAATQVSLLDVRYVTAEEFTHRFIQSIARPASQRAFGGSSAID